MESSSRIFVKNLPPTITEAEFRKHFSAEGRQVTDVKLIPARHIGFVGYKSAEDAARAVKYFNRSFIRMSRIAVDIAKPIADSIPHHKSASRGPSKDVGPKNVPKVVPPNTKVTAPAVPKEEAAPDAPKRKLDVLDEADPKLQEYLDVMGAHPSKKMRNAEGLPTTVDEVLAPAVPAGLEDGESDDEYEDIPARTQNQSTHLADQEMVDAPLAPSLESSATPAAVESSEPAPQVSLDATDDDWLRSRTNRLLDLVDPDDAAFALRPAASAPAPAPASAPVPASSVENTASAKAEEHAAEGSQETAATSAQDPESAISLIEKTSRLFLRNLSYTVTEDDVREHFAKFGALEEVHVPLDSKGHSKGFAMIRYEKPASALAAFQTDGTVFQGRIVHILPAAAKRENKLDEFALSKLPLKKQQLLRKKAEAASSTFNWNSLFMSQDAVNTAMAERLGVSKAELLDPTDASAAVKQAVAETTVIQEAKSYFAANGVNIEAFKTQQRGDTTILVKNIKNTTIEELRTLFEEHGTVLRVLMPLSGTIAIVQFAQPVQCRTAFARKAYSRFKDSVLFLEKGPKGLFTDNVAAPTEARPAGVQKPSVADLLERDDAEEQSETSSLFVRNLNFSTTSQGLTDAFKHLDGFVNAKVKTKTDPKKPGQVLSMGFGFVAFRTKDQAQAALKVMDGQVLDAHKLSVKASHRGLDAAEERRREDMAKKAASQGTKLVIKNLPFEVTKKEVRTLFSTYGKLVALRIPKKFNQSSRGFAFAEFSTAKEALNAFNSLKDTHILGRRLVIDFAQAEDIDPEDQIAAMEKKTRAQVNKVALQQLTGTGRAKVTIGDNDEDEV
ncbi:Multiple RNA-binding domain-containing protein 1 [Neurospora sp. IMI 360204]|nr:Multiple RNA-binding domain-containing protein 1 [Neurospora sp. IMI 360204]